LWLQNSTVTRWKKFAVGPSRATNFQTLIAPSRKEGFAERWSWNNQSTTKSTILLSVSHDLTCILAWPQAQPRVRLWIWNKLLHQRISCIPRHMDTSYWWTTCMQKRRQQSTRPISLSTVVLNSRDWPKKIWCPKFWHVQNPLYNRLYAKKLTKMHWYIYNNTVLLLNIAKTRIFYLTYNFKIFKCSTILFASLPACCKTR